MIKNNKNNNKISIRSLINIELLFNKNILKLIENQNQNQTKNNNILMYRIKSCTNRLIDLEEQSTNAISVD